MMGTLLQDLRYGFRMLVKSPGFTLTAVLALALGIGVNSAIFSVINAILLRPLPYANQEQLVVLTQINQKKGLDQVPVSPPDLADWKSQSHAFSNMAAYRSGSSASFNLTSGAEPERIQGAFVSADLLPLLGVQPFKGRNFTADEEKSGGNPVVIISHGLWQRRFGSDPDLVGRSLTMNGVSYSVIGIMPPSFQFPVQPDKVELWVPLSLPNQMAESRMAHMLRVVARLKPGVTEEQARSEMNTIAQRLQQQYPESNTDMGIAVIPLLEQIVGNIRTALYILLGAVGFVLLIACANVANLLLARATARQKEIAIRTALGASRLRLIRQLLTESVLLALLGGALGLLLAMWGLDLLVAVSPNNIPRLKDVGLDGWVLGFTLLVSLLTGIIFGLTPALQASRTDLTESLKEGGKSSAGLHRSRMRNALVVSEVALALLLLIGAGLMMRSFMRLRQVNPGFNPEQTLTMRIALPDAKYKEDYQVHSFYQQVLQRVASLPGVQSADVVTSVPLSGQQTRLAFEIIGRPAAPGELLDADYRAVSAGYFRTMSIPLIKGRFFTDRDTQESPGVLIINEAMARRYWPNEDPLGKHLNVGPAPHEIVGVVGDVKQMGLDAGTDAEMYEPYLQAPWNALTLVVRTNNAEPKNLAAAVTHEVHAVDKDQPVSNIKPMDEIVSESVAQPRLYMLLLNVFAGVALLLAAVGLFGVIAYSVTQRTHEIGIRMALGAQQSDVLKLVVGQGMLLALLGVGIGLLAAFLTTRILQTFLYGISSVDPLTFIIGAVVLSTVAFLASLIPARRAIKVNPMIALRYE
jgi:putative ABC transport system permease protein